MLKFIGSQSCERNDNEIEFGDYLPFKLTHQQLFCGPKFYWRTGDLVSTLVEVEINSVTGQIIGVTLLLPGMVSKDFPELTSPNASRCDGYPIVDVRDWPESGIKDELNSLRVFVDSSRLLIVFSDFLETGRTISAGNATYGVDANGAMVWLLISNLLEEKLKALENL